MLHNEGQALKSVEELHINDFIPLAKEKDYDIRAKFHKFTYDLLKRHPKLFVSILNGLKRYSEDDTYIHRFRRSKHTSSSSTHTQRVLLL